MEIEEWGEYLVIKDWQTKNLKKLELIKSISNIKVGISLTTLNDKISKRIEPGASLSNERLQTLKKLSKEKIKCYAFILPVIPYITNVFQIIDEVYEYVGYICFENLNLRSPYKCEILNFAKEVLSKDKYQDFKRIFNDSNYGKI